MRLALPEHQGRIAPVFDNCRRLQIFLIVGTSHELEFEQDWTGCRRELRPLRLKELGIETLICGGISCWTENQIRMRQIRVIPWMSGDICDILPAFCTGCLHDPKFFMPGRSPVNRGQCKHRRAHRRSSEMSHFTEQENENAKI